MTSTKYSNPFTPGFGAIPPHLAGREEEQSVLLDSLSYLSAGKSPPAATAVYGPRGMGKTVLLRWLKNKVEQSEEGENSIRVEWVTPAQLNSSDDLWSSIAPSAWYSNIFGNVKKVNAGLVVEGAGGNAGIEMRKPITKNFSKSLIKKNKNRPLLLLIDEAHKMDQNLCYQLLNAHQILSDEMPFMLVLAGTPGVHNLLSNVDASFIERSTYISLGRLDEKSSADAVRIPLKEHGIQITDDALSLIVEGSQCYPYFLQRWGSSIWKVANKENFTRITDEHVANVMPEITRQRNKFYGRRGKKIEELGLRPISLAIAKAFQDKKAMPSDDILKIIRDNLPVGLLSAQPDIELQQKTYEFRQSFIDHDFIWQSEESDLYEPGIPSFMAHMLNLQTVHIKTEPERKSTYAVEHNPIDNGKDSDGLGF